MLASAEERLAAFSQVSVAEGLPLQAVEKDWWACLCLRALFTSEHAKYLTFKGGTSLSKGWALIDRFSEDIDIAIDRAKWGYDASITETQIGRVRKKNRRSVREELVPGLLKTLAEWGIPSETLKVEVVEKQNEAGKIVSDHDPTEIIVGYPTLFKTHPYVDARLKIEIGVRSMPDPVEARFIRSFVDAHFEGQPVASPAFEVVCILPTRTFLEKAILLHEGFRKPFSPQKAERKSRHLYDLVQLMDTEHASKALENAEGLFEEIVSHRKKFSPERGTDYEGLNFQTLNFLPPQDTLSFWEADYKKMAESMLRGEVLPFSVLMEKLTALQERFRQAAR